MAAISERGSDAAGYCYRGPDVALAIHKQRSGASRLLDAIRVPAHARQALVHVRDYTKGHPSLEANNHPIRHGSVVGIHNGIIRNDEEIFAEYGFERAAPKMTVDSEAIFALMELERSSAQALDKLYGSMASAWMDEREPDVVYLARGMGRPLWIGEGRHALFFASTKAALELVESYAGVSLASRELSEGTLLSVSARPGRPDRVLPSPIWRSARSPSPPCARPRSTAPASRFWLRWPRPPRLARLPASEPPLNLPQERRPGARAPAEEPVDLPFARELRVQSPLPRPVLEGRQAAEPRRKANAFLHRALGPLFRPRNVETGRAERGAERAERLPVERFRRHRASPPLEVGARRGPPQLGAELPELEQKLLAGREPSRDEPGAPLRPVPAAEARHDGLRMRLRPGRRARTRASSASVRGVLRSHGALRGAFRRCSARDRAMAVDAKDRAG